MSDHNSNRNDGGENLPETVSIAQAKEAMEKAQSVLAFIEREGLVGCEAALYLLHHGSDVQKVAVARELQFYASNEDEVLNLLTLVASLIEKETTPPEFEISAAVGLEKLLFADQVPDYALPTTSHFERLVQAAVAVDRQSLDTWIPLVKNLSARMDDGDIVDVAIPWLVENLKDEGTRGRQRLIAAHISGTLFSTMPNIVIPQLWKPYFSLRNDSSSHVRLAIVENFRLLSTVMGPGVTKTVLLPQMMGTMLDDNHQVAGAFFEYLLELHDFFEPEFQEDVVVGILFGYLDNKPPPQVQEFVAKGIGRLAHYFRINKDLKKTEKLCKAYKEFALANQDTLRQHAAFNAPAMILEFKDHPDQLQDIIDNVNLLATDSSLSVRISIAAGFEKMCSTLPPMHLAKAKETLRSLFVDSEVSVQQRIAETLPSLCKSFLAFFGNDASRVAFLSSVLSFISSYEAKIRSNWRKVKSLIDCFPELMEFLPSSDIVMSLLPILLTHITYGAQALKDECAELIIACLRKCVELKADKTIMTTACNRTLKLTASASAPARVAFIQLSVRFAEEMKEESFVACFEQALIHLFADPIYSVRRRLALALPSYPKELREVLFDGLTSDLDASVREACKSSKKLFSEADARSSKSNSVSSHPRHHKRSLDPLAGVIAKLMKEFSHQ